MRSRQNLYVCLQGRKRQDRLPAPAQISVLVFIMLDIWCWRILPLMASLFRSYTMSAVPRLRPLLMIVRMSNAHWAWFQVQKSKILKMARWAGTCHSGQQRTWACQTLRRVPAGNIWKQMHNSWWQICIYWELKPSVLSMSSPECLFLTHQSRDWKPSTSQAQQWSGQLVWTVEICNKGYYIVDLW